MLTDVQATDLMLTDVQATDLHGTHFCQRLSRPLVHSAAGRIKSMKNSNYIIRNQTRDLTHYSADRYRVPQLRLILPRNTNI
jgi:hypothetical protein